MSPRQLTVLQVLPALESGGVERGVLEIAEALVAAGHRSLVVSNGGRMVAELIDRGSQHFQRAHRHEITVDVAARRLASETHN